MAINISYFAGAGAQFFDSNGTPLVGGLLYVYSAGTTTPVATFTTVAGTVNNTNPIVLDAGGRTPNEIWLNGGVLYKFVLETALGVTIGTYDNIPAVNDPTVFNNIITVTGTNTLLGTSTPPISAYFRGQTLSFVPVNSNTGATTISVDGLGAREITFDASTALSSGAIQAGKIALLEYDGVRFQLVNSITAAQIPDGVITTPKLADGAVTTIKLDDGAVTTAKLAAIAINSKIQPITASIATNALTATLNPTTLDFRSATLTSGTVTTLPVDTAISLVAPSGATLGTVDAVQSRLIVLAINNAGTVELAVVNPSNGLNLNETGLVSTTALSTGSDSANVIYSTTARTNVAYRVVGYIESTQATAGTWATAPSTIQGYGGQSGVPIALNASNGAPLFAARAWVNFDGTGTVAIRASGNVSSITDNGTGDYTVNFTVAMPDANYAFAGSGDNTSSTTAVMWQSSVSRTTTALRVTTGLPGSTLGNPANVNVVVFR
jgi:hypothetical protein